MKALRAEELRIGNKIGYNVFIGETFTVKAITTNRVLITRDKTRMEFKPEYSECEPIPLTEEWLLKFGFEKDKDGILYLDAWQRGEGQRFIIEMGTNGKMFCRSRYQEWSDHFVMNDLKCVHQLQNLYFALTHTELTLNTKG